jgi:signal transduction histidine kinase
MRKVTAVLAVCWAATSIVLSLATLRNPGERLTHPFVSTRLGGDVVLTQVSPTATAAGIRSGDRLLAINGDSISRVARRGVDWMQAHVANAYLIERPAGERYIAELVPVPFAEVRGTATTLLHFLVVLVAGIYLVTGGAVWWLRPGKSEAWAFVLFCSAMTVQLSTSMQTDAISWAWPRLLVNVPFIGASAFHLFTSYPIEPDWLVRHRRIQLVPYAFAFGLAALTLVEEPLNLPQGLMWFAGIGFTVALFSGSLVIVGIERAKASESIVRDHADVVFWGAVLSFTPVLAVLTAEWVFQQAYDYQLALLWLFLFPVVIGYGIVRKQIFDLRMLARSSAAYGVSSFAITSMFALLITFADVLVSWLEIDFLWFQVTFLFLAILLFNPLRERLQDLVDRFFDRDRAYSDAVREISEAMVSMLSLTEITDRILVALTDSMGVDRAMVLLVEDEGKQLRPMNSRGDWDEGALDSEIPSEHPIWKHLWMRREELSRADFDDEPDLDNREACRDVFDSLEVELLVPILYGVDLLGCIAVGRTLSGERLAGDDRALVRTLANQSSVAIENAKAFDEIAGLNETLEARVEQRTAELREIQVQLIHSDKMKSIGQMVAGVAHELNNPIGFVHANLQLIDEFVKKLVDPESSPSEIERTQERIQKLLKSSREGTNRVKKIVQDLRTFSRMDQAELQEVNLHEEIDRTIELMEPRFKNQISVVRNYGEIPRVHCYIGQLNQVFMNLLGNACDAMGTDGTITITTRTADSGIEMVFEDDGPGIPDDVRSRIFDPFFTTKPVGVGTGLGLSISHSILERHDGRLSVDSELGAGTRFTIELPIDLAPES